jgi:FAD/FMN-containing dehydrogenase
MLSHDDLHDELTQICGKKYIITEEGDMAPYLKDWRGDYLGKAAAIVCPGNTGQVAAIMTLANKNGIPVVPQGGNTSLCGAATPDDSGAAIVLAMGRMNKIRSLDKSSQTMVVEAGCILEDIQNAAKKNGFLFPLNFGSRGTCQIGGNLATNAGGLNVVRYGNARQLCLGLEVVTPSGEVMDLLSSLKKDNAGYDMKNLFIGSEGTLGIITAATLQLFPPPLAAATAWAGVRNIDAAIGLLAKTQAASGGNVVSFELMSEVIIDNVLKFYPEVAAPIDDLPEFSCLIEIASTRKTDAGAGKDGSFPLEEVMAALLEDAMEDGLVSDATIARNENQRQALWSIRESIPESEVMAGPGYKSDISVPLEHMSAFYGRAAAAADAVVPGIKVFGFGHLGDGNLHYNLSAPDSGKADFAAHYPEFDKILKNLLREYHGSISAEHGIGQKKRQMLEEIKDPVALAMMRNIKSALDPNGIMNPGKVLY